MHVLEKNKSFALKKPFGVRQSSRDFHGQQPSRKNSNYCFTGLQINISEYKATKGNHTQDSKDSIPEFFSPGSIPKKNHKLSSSALDNSIINNSSLLHRCRKFVYQSEKKNHNPNSSIEGSNEPKNSNRWHQSLLPTDQFLRTRDFQGIHKASMGSRERMSSRNRVQDTLRRDRSKSSQNKAGLVTAEQQLSAKHGACDYDKFIQRTIKKIAHDADKNY